MFSFVVPHYYLFIIISDPRQRLALFKKLEESSKMRPVAQPSRKTLPKKEYFKGKKAQDLERFFVILHLSAF